MKILLTNDDGIYAPGIEALYNAVKDMAEVSVVAPDSQRSAVGHGITLSDPIKTVAIQRDGKLFGHATSGTPADCVKLAVCALLDHKPDLVISGINLGPNAGIAAIYSGTVSAATEGAILGLPSVAISIDTFTNPIWDTPARVMQKLIPYLEKHPLPRDTVLNVNVPNLPYEKLKGVASTRMARSRYVEIFDKRADPRGNIYYWMDGNMEIMGDQDHTDLDMLAKGYVSMTPIGFDLTRHELVGTVADWKVKL
ncbi:MAG: 5'/3'-nucleotidase SurE [Kiritimatiellia bacterium]